jgi:acyl dehydratase
MLPLYLRAALPRHGSRSDAAPDVVLRLTGVRPSAARVARYAAVVGQPPSDRLPLLYPQVLGFGLQLAIMTDPSFAFPALGLVHVANQVATLRPLLLGEELDVAVHAGAVRRHPRGRVVDLLTEVRSGGVVVWTQTGSYLRRERPPVGDGADGGDTGGDTDGGDTDGGDTDGGENPGAATDLVDAAEPPLHLAALRRLPADLGRRYAGVSGDVNPIHLSALTARPLGFPRAIAHGMWAAAAVVGALEGRLPPALAYTVRFRRPITLPGTVRLFTAVDGDRVRAELRGPEGDDRPRLTADIRPHPDGRGIS